MTETFVSRHGHVRYGLEKMHSGPCEGDCGEPATGLDHCHAHGWIRGALCARCNGVMRRIDAKQPGSYPQALTDHWSNCPDCATGGPWSPYEPPAEPSRKPCKTSVYLTGDVHARWRASGVPLAEIVRRGLDVTEGTDGEEPLSRAVLREILREELAHLQDP